MNKTININLANVFFHIDEDAFMKLDKYLKTIESYLANEESRDEILQDIEARIAELFTESMAHHNQVITMIQVDKMISIMGEPEAYKIDDEEDSSSTFSRPRSARKLYRDIDRNYVGGVSAGLNHYLGLNLLLIRFIWIISALSSFGATVIIYAILWAIIPPARTTAQKLDMQGEPVNLSNIERKVKESYSKFADKVGGIDYEKYEQQTKSGIAKFFDGLGEVLKALSVFISKFLGIILLIISGALLVGLVIFLFSFGTISLFDLADFTKMDFFPLGVPYWIQVVLFFTAAAVPFFYLLILSLKLLISNLKSIGKISHITLTGLWILSIIIITTLGVKRQLENSYGAIVDEMDSIELKKLDTLRISMNNDLFINNESNDSKIYNVSVNLKPSDNDELKVKISKRSYGPSQDKARDKAKMIDYDYEFENSNLLLNTYFQSNTEFFHKKEKVELTLYIPKEHTIYLDEDVKFYNKVWNLNRSDFNTYLGYKDNTWKPLDSIIQIDSTSTQN